MLNPSNNSIISNVILVKKIVQHPVSLKQINPLYQTLKRLKIYPLIYCPWFLISTIYLYTLPIKEKYVEQKH